MTSSAERPLHFPALALVVAFALACAQTQAPSGPDTDDSESAYQSARAELARDPVAGRAALEAFLVQWPRGARSDDVGVELAELDLAEGNADAAAERLRTVIRLHPSGDRTSAARLALARLEMDSGSTNEAYRVASAIRPARLTPDERIEAFALMAEIDAARGHEAGRLSWLALLAAEPGDRPESAAAAQEIDATLAALDRDSLEALANQLGDDPPANRVVLAMAEREIAAGDLGEAQRSLDELAGRDLSEGEVQRLRALELRLRAVQGLPPEPGPGLATFAEVSRLAAPPTEGAAGTLGVVLPLTGRFARYGEASLRGILIAIGMYGDAREARAVRLLVRDSAGAPATAAAAVAGLARDSEVQAIVGPLLGEEAESAAGLAESAGVPLLTLTRREGIEREGLHVFRMGLTPRAELSTLADFAFDTLGVRNVAILYPRDAAGRGMKDLFWDAVEARGGRVTGVGSYAPGATDFAEPLRGMIGYALIGPQEKEILKAREKLRNEAKRSPPEVAAELRLEADEMLGPNEQPLPPIVDFDALFVPDTVERVELVAPAMAFHEVMGVRLLGVSGWNHEELVRIGGRYVEGAVFSEAFDPQSRFDFVAAFSDRYQAAYGELPDLFAAQGYDAANLLLVQLARGLTTREEIREGLLAVRGFPGASGITNITSEGAARKRPFLLGVEKGKIVSLD